MNLPVNSPGRTTGKRLVLKTEFIEGGPFKRGLAEVSNYSRSGYMDKKGKVIIPLTHDPGGWEYEGDSILAVGHREKYAFYNYQGKRLRNNLELNKSV